MISFDELWPPAIMKAARDAFLITPFHLAFELIFNSRLDKENLQKVNTLIGGKTTAT